MDVPSKFFFSSEKKNALLSHRGRILIINNLVASLLWHYLACINPPPGLLAKFNLF